MITYLNLIKNVTEEMVSKPSVKFRYGKDLKNELINKANSMSSLYTASKELDVPYKTLYSWVNGR